MQEDTISDFDPETGNTNKKKRFKIYPIYIHGAFLLILLLVLLLFLLSDFSLFSNEEEPPELVVIGSQDEFFVPYEGDLTIRSSEFKLNTPGGRFDGRSQTFHIVGFDGIIEKANSSLFFRGTSQNITFGTNFLNTNGSYLELESPKRTRFSVLLDELELDFNNGQLKFADELSYDYENITINMKGLNATINYDGRFTLRGIVDSFTANTSKNLFFSYSQTNSSS